MHIHVCICDLFVTFPAEDYDFNAGVAEEEQTLGPSRGAAEEDSSPGIEERLEELELMEEMDDMPDVPAVDMM